MSTVTYPYDPTGTASSNLISLEPHVLSEVNSTTERIIVPDFAPFYLDNLGVLHRNGSTDTPLVQGIDFDPCMPFMGASRSIGKYLFGGLAIHNDYTQGVLLVTYRTLGGQWLADKNYVLQQLIEKIYNPRVVYWDQITNVQQTFPPSEHQQDYDDITGQADVVEKIQGIIEAILAGPQAPSDYINHILQTGNVHGMTAADLHLENVPNIGLATQAELDALTPAEKLITLKQLVQSGIVTRLFDATNLLAQIGAERTAAINERISQLTKSDVGLANVVNLPLATAQEVADKIASNKYVMLSQVLTLLQGFTPKKTALLTPESYFIMGHSGRR